MTVTVNLLFKLLLWLSLNEPVPTAGFALREAKLNANSDSNSPQNSEETGKYPMIPMLPISFSYNVLLAIYRRSS